MATWLTHANMRLRRILLEYAELLVLALRRIQKLVLLLCWNNVVLLKHAGGWVRLRVQRWAHLGTLSKKRTILLTENFTRPWNSCWCGLFYPIVTNIFALRSQHKLVVICILILLWLLLILLLVWIVDLFKIGRHRRTNCLSRLIFLIFLWGLSRPRWWLKYISKWLLLLRYVQLIIWLCVVVAKDVLIIIIIPIALVKYVFKIIIDLLSQVEFIFVYQWFIQGVKQIRQTSIHLVLCGKQILVTNDKILFNFIIFDAVLLAHLVSSKLLHAFAHYIRTFLLTIVFLADHVAGRSKIVLVSSQAIACLFTFFVGIQLGLSLVVGAEHLMVILLPI